jgi:hypothetical protein
MDNGLPTHLHIQHQSTMMIFDFKDYPLQEKQPSYEI